MVIGGRCHLPTRRTTSSSVYSQTVDGQPEYHPEGIYYLRYYDGDQNKIWERVGKDSDAAIAAQFRREQSLRAKAAGLQINEEKKEVRIPLEFANRELPLRRKDAAVSAIGETLGMVAVPLPGELREDLPR